MIKLKRHPAPDFLSAEKVQELTVEFYQSKKSVWNKKRIKDPLLESSFNKCAYCEVNIVEESKYMEVEHFRHKDQFPNLVVDWDNLLPSCKRCNGKKGTHNVETNGMIINPFDVVPSEHLYFRDYRLRWRDELGRRTIIDVLYLNDTEKLVSVRMELGSAICDALEDIRCDLEEYVGGGTTVRKRAKIIRGLERLLREAQPGSEFSALAATVLLTDPNYLWIKERISEFEEWPELESLEEAARMLLLVE